MQAYGPWFCLSGSPNRGGSGERRHLGSPMKNSLCKGTAMGTDSKSVPIAGGVFSSFQGVAKSDVRTP